MLLLVSHDAPRAAVLSRRAHQRQRPRHQQLHQDSEESQDLRSVSLSVHLFCVKVSDLPRSNNNRNIKGWIFFFRVDIWDLELIQFSVFSKISVHQVVFLEEKYPSKATRRCSAIVWRLYVELLNTNHLVWKLTREQLLHFLRAVFNWTQTNTDVVSWQRPDTVNKQWHHPSVM